MNSKFNIQPTESDIDLGIDLSQEPELKNQSDDLQRTDEWFEERRGNFTASGASNLMSCDRKTGKMSWLQPEKTFGFSEGVLKFIFGKAMERITGRVIKTKQTPQMKYGEAVEGLVFDRTNLLLKKDGLYAEKVGYKKIPGFENAGSSSDAVIKRISDDKIIANAEIKCCTSWDTLFDRTFDKTNEKSKDFWQTTQQMLSWEVDSTFYIVISPPEDIFKYAYSDDIESLYDDWASETEINIEKIALSQIHADALKKRIQMSERIIDEYLDSEDQDLRRVFYEVIDDEKRKMLDLDKVESEEIQKEDETIEEKSEFELLQENKEKEKDLDSIDDIDDDLPF